MIVVIDYRAGNLYNVGNALRHLGAEFVFSGDAETVSRASRVILPGVGAARAAMESLNERDLVSVLQNLKVPFLGICLGLQLLYERSEEEQASCLGILEGAVRRFDSRVLKVPHIGWNEVDSNFLPLFKGIPPRSRFYFVHSYYAPRSPRMTQGITEYGVDFSSVAIKDNYWGVQFHPEKSGEPGLALLKNFLEWEG
jgi:imidazole glycerol-phosphate synthase subunit HisH